MGRVFTEGFDKAMRGWIGWTEKGGIPVEVRDGAAVSRGPWWVDFNHAPPGGGYLHILFALHTQKAAGGAGIEALAGPNPLATGQFPTDYRNAKISCRLKGKVDMRGASLVFLAQGKVKSVGRMVNQVFMGQRFNITSEWTHQTIQLVPDQKQWVQLGTRHDRTEMYAEGPIEELLADMNGDFIFVLFPLDVRPAKPIQGDPHILRAGAEYEVDRSRLPTGEVWMDDFKIEFAG